LNLRLKDLPFEAWHGQPIDAEHDGDERYDDPEDRAKAPRIAGSRAVDSQGCEVGA
jgi:hypothetical protein